MVCCGQCCRWSVACQLLFFVEPIYPLSTQYTISIVHKTILPPPPPAPKPLCWSKDTINTESANALSHHHCTVLAVAEKHNYASLHSISALHHETVRRGRFTNCLPCVGGISGYPSNVSAFITCVVNRRESPLPID